VSEKYLSRGDMFLKSKKYKGKLAATKMGKEAFNFLKENNHGYISLDTTRKLENNIDLIEKGEASYIEILKELYEEMLKINKPV